MTIADADINMTEAQAQPTPAPETNIPQAPVESAPVAADTENVAESATPPTESPAPSGTEKPWYYGRIDTLTAQRKQAEAERDAALAALRAANAGAGGTVANVPADTGQGAATYTQTPVGVPAGYVPAEQLESLVEQRARQQAYNDSCNAVFQKGTAEFGAEFAGMVETLQRAGVMQQPFIEAVLAAGGESAHKVLVELAKNPAQAIGLASIPSPAVIGAEVAKLAAKSQVKPQTSKAPAPIVPITAPTPAPTVDLETMSMDDFFATRNKQIAERNGRRW